MATPHSTEELSRKQKPPATPYFQYFQDDTASLASALPSPWPLSAANFMDVQLRELAQLNDRLNRLNQQFNPLIEVYIPALCQSMRLRRYA